MKQYTALDRKYSNGFTRILVDEDIRDFDTAIYIIDEKGARYNIAGIGKSYEPKISPDTLTSIRLAGKLSSGKLYVIDEGLLDEAIGLLFEKYGVGM